MSEDPGQPAPIRVDLIGRPGCHLCEEARTVVRRVCAETGTGWRERLTTEDPRLAAEYAEFVPVVLVDGRWFSYWQVDPAQLHNRLRSGAPDVAGFNP